MKVHHSMCWLRAVCNAWITAARFPVTGDLNCLFGCSEGDALRHYVVCPALWRSVFRATAFVVPSLLCDRLCLRNCSPESVVSLCVASHTLHSLRGRRARPVPEHVLVSLPYQMFYTQRPLLIIYHSSLTSFEWPLISGKKRMLFSEYPVVSCQDIFTSLTRIN